jgi:hypothetical protein
MLLFWMVACVSAWQHAPDAFSTSSFDAVLVPGCPANDDGTVSSCQWRRASWAAELFHGGSVDHVIVSGGAVYNPYVEAEGLAVALEARGVPTDRITLEPKARHTDQNAAFSLSIAEDRGWSRLAVASDGLHAVIMEKMLTEWSAELEVVALPVQSATMAEELPHLPLTPVADWLPPEQVDQDRPAPIFSLPNYIWKGLTSPVLEHEAPA